MNIRPEGGAWALGCAFISPLSDEELEALTRSAAFDEAAPAETSIADVHFRGTLPGGEVVQRRILKLNHRRSMAAAAGPADRSALPRRPHAEGAGGRLPIHGRPLGAGMHFHRCAAGRSAISD